MNIIGPLCDRSVTAAKRSELPANARELARFNGPHATGAIEPTLTVSSSRQMSQDGHD